MELNGNPSPRRIRRMRSAAMAQSASSLQTSAVIELDTPRLRKAKRTAMKPKRDINRPTQVNGETFECIGFFGAVIIPLKLPCPKAGVLEECDLAAQRQMIAQDDSAREKNGGRHGAKRAGVIYEMCLVVKTVSRRRARPVDFAIRG